MAQLKDIVQNTKDIYMTDSSLNILLDFERVLDELDLYVFKNWKKGELVEGPDIEKYFITCIFMWPYKMMPDPRGAERLAEYGVEIRYKRTHLEQPVKKVEDQEDFKPGTKYPKSETKPVWLVEMIMPKKLISDINQGSLELENDVIDMEDVDQAYEDGTDKESTKTSPNGNEQEPSASEAPVGTTV